MDHAEHGVSLYLELPTIFLAALFGAAYFSSRGMSAIGVLGIGLVFGLGGGILRDIILNIEPAAFQYWYFVPVALAGALTGGVLRTRYTSERATRWLRNLVTALLLLIGLEKAYTYGNPVVSVILIGVITAVGGTLTVGLLTHVDMFAHAGGAYLALCLLTSSLVFIALAATSLIVLSEVVAGSLFILMRIYGARRGWSVPQLPGEYLTDQPDPAAQPASTTS